MEFILCWSSGMWPALEYNWYIQGHFIVGNESSFLSGHQLQTPSWLGMKFCTHFPLVSPWPLSAWAFEGLVCGTLVFVSSYMHQNCCVEDTAFLESSITPGSYNISASSSIQTPELWGKGFNEIVPFRTEDSKVSCSLYIVQLWVSVLVPLYCKKKVLWWQLTEPLIHRYSNMSLGNIFLLCSISVIRVVGFLLGLDGEPLSCSWLLNSIVYGFHLMD